MPDSPESATLAVTIIPVSLEGGVAAPGHKAANFGNFFARCARQQILDQIFENTYLGPKSQTSKKQTLPPKGPSKKVVVKPMQHALRSVASTTPT